MNYRDALAELSAIEASGRSRFDSHFLARKFGCKVAAASKWMYRLHRMNFVKRTRIRRMCISKRGKLCYKGYCYEYSLSSQGRQYVTYMNLVEPLQMAETGRLAEQTFQLMSEDSRKTVVDSILIREGSKYKGGNHSLQALGIMTRTLPDICKSFNESKARNKELEIEKEILKAKIEHLESKISSLENENDLLKKVREEQETQIPTQGLPQFFIKVASMIMKERQLAFDVSAMWELLYVTQKGLVRDLAEVLFVNLSSRMSYEEACRILEMIFNRSKEGFTMAQDYRRRALADCQQFQALDISIPQQNVEPE